jgi:hypothetical protein
MSLTEHEKAFITRLESGDLSEHQLVFINALLDREWHDRRALLQIPEMKGVWASTIKQRVIQPFEALGFIEQEDRPAERKKRGGSSKKKYVHLKDDVDEYRLHQIIIHSANQVVNKYNEKLADLYKQKDETKNTKQMIVDHDERYKFFLQIRNNSLKKCKELEQLAEEQRNEYWKQRESYIPDSKSWPQLVTIERKLADAFEEYRRSSGVRIPAIERDRIRAKAALLAREISPDLWKRVLEEAHQHENTHGQRLADSLAKDD